MHTLANLAGLNVIGKKCQKEKGWCPFLVSTEPKIQKKETQLNEKHVATFHWQILIKSQYMKSKDKLTPEYMGSICLSAYIGA